MLHRLHQLRRWAGIDRAVFFTNASQLTRLFTGPVTMVLVLRCLTSEIQGYFYAFSGIVAMQVFLEMGFSQNILQFASHEFARLHFTPQDTLAGDPAARSRLISLGRLAFGYYAVAALVFLLVVGVGGHIFFTVSAHHDPARHAVAWQGAWWIIVVTAALALAINPAGMLLAGCNQIAVTARFGFWQTLAGFAVGALALLAGTGIYASAIGAVASLLLSAGYFLVRWRPFFAQFLERPRHGEVSWAREIWPFQWRIAVSWMSGYFIFDIINPLAFYFCGPVAAGRLGMSNQFVRMIFNVAMNWINTKLPRFGMLVAARDWPGLDALWRRSTLQSIGFYLLGITAFLAAIPLIGQWFPQVPARLAPWAVNAWLGGAMLLQTVVSAMAMELRAHKREPYMWLSVIGAFTCSGFMLALVRVGGINGEVMGFCLSALVGFVPCLIVYRLKRLEYRRTADRLHAPVPPPETAPPPAGFPGIQPET